MNEQASAGPKRHWQIGPYDFGMYSPLRWECSAHGLGSGGRMPWTAWLNLKRWAKDYRSKPPYHWMEEEQ